MVMIWPFASTPGLFTLKTRIALATSLFFLAFVGITTMLTVTYFTREYRASISAQQFELLSAIARSIDEDLARARAALVRAATGVPPAAFSSTEVAQHFLDDRFVLRAETFNLGLALIDNAGRVIAEGGRPEAAGSRNVADRAYFQAVLRDGRPVISAPHLSDLGDGRPALTIAMPIHGANGERLGQLHGTMELLSRSFLGSLFDIRVGRSGYVFIVTVDRQIVLHPDATRILQRGSRDGVNPMMDRAVSGFEGSGETVNSQGVEQFVTFRRLANVPWVVGSAWPLDEAYEPFNRAKRLVLAAMAIGALLMLAAAWLTTRFHLAPLERLTTHIRAFSQKRGTDRLAPTQSGGEVAALAEAFNQMVVEADRRANALAASEAKAAEALRYLDRAMAAVDSMVTLWNEREELVYVNSHFYTVYARVADRIRMGIKFTEYAELLWDAGYVLNYPKSRAEFLDERIRQFRSPDRFFTRMVAPGKWMRMSEIRLPDGWTATASTEITDIVRHELELTETNQRLAEQAVRLELLNQDHAREREAARAANEAKTQFLANMSHELRTPLNAIIGFSEVLERQLFGPLTPRYLEYSRDILGAGRHLLSVINDILDLSRIEVGRYEVAGAMINIADPVNSCVAMMRERLASKDQVLALDVESDAPPIYADPRVIKQVVLNLLSNAVKFTPERGRIGVSARITPQGALRIIISDSGIGMSRDAVGRAFDPFWQAEHAYHRKHEGTGLGLAITKRLVELHGGSIDIASTPGGGTTVTIVLPDLHAVLDPPSAARNVVNG